MTGKNRFLRACRREIVDRTPVWLMRQAGRYMPEYRELRKNNSLLTLCRTPELAAQVTLQPIKRFGFDAAIIFADILLPLEPFGLKFEFAAGEGPIIHDPITDAAAVSKLRLFEPAEELRFVSEAIQMVRPELADETALIGFAGAPFTLASYMIEGGHSRNFLKTRQFMFQATVSWHRLMETVSVVTQRYLTMQVEAGADAIQLFDSWVGILSPDDYRNFVLPYSKKALESIDAPTIHFSTGTSSYLDLVAEAGGDIISIDWRSNLQRAWEQIPQKAIQGNLDPAALLKNKNDLRTEIRNVLSNANSRPGHIFNLGHGVFPETPIENVEALVDEVRAWPLKSAI